MKDEIFKEKITKQFEFDTAVATVFDDMLNRSVPYYEEVLKLTTSFTLKYATNNSNIYDLGCSTASTLINIAKHNNKNLHLIGIDNSYAMLEIAQNKIKAFGIENIELIESDIFEVDLKSSKVIISNYTLQFIRPLKREELIKKIYNSLEKDGIFIFSEKIITDDKSLNKHLIDEYYDFKLKQGYSEYEIAQKREALENVLIPYTYEENKDMVLNAGFKHFDSIFRWINFATFIAIK